MLSDWKKVSSSISFSTHEENCEALARFSAARVDRLDKDQLIENAGYGARWIAKHKVVF